MYYSSVYGTTQLWHHMAKPTGGIRVFNWPRHSISNSPSPQSPAFLNCADEKLSLPYSRNFPPLIQQLLSPLFYTSAQFKSIPLLCTIPLLCYPLPPNYFLTFSFTHLVSTQSVRPCQYLQPPTLFMPCIIPHFPTTINSTHWWSNIQAEVAGDGSCVCELCL